MFKPGDKVYFKPEFIRKFPYADWRNACKIKLLVVGKREGLVVVSEEKSVDVGYIVRYCSTNFRVDANWLSPTPTPYERLFN